ncbi:hypothetical protein C8Q77DRAFT_1143553 [Trametes polyzona]|nr:hypothetical protein C8Q77DRAFT_1143553 [Trametes polyzona]
MSVAGSDYGGSSYGRSEPRPDKPLVVKCVYEDRGGKKISYPSARICTFDNLRRQVEKIYGLNSTSFAITYVDDDTETIYIQSEADLTEAINYFKVGDDAPLSSAASILSGRSFRQSRITLKVNIVVDYDGISLSDTGSLVSLEEYRNRNGSGFSLSHSSIPPRELEDDAMTVSSKDVGSKYDPFLGKGPRTIVAGPSREPLIEPTDNWEVATISSAPRTTSSQRSRDMMSPERALARYPEDPSSVLAMLKLEEERQGVSPGQLNGASTFETERGANWLREQSAHFTTTLNGDGMSMSEFSLEDNMSLELEKNQHGNYRYTLTGSSGSAASQSARDYITDDGASAVVNDAFESVADPSEKRLDSRPTSMQTTQFTHPHRVSNPFLGPGENQSVSSDFIHPDIPPEVLSFLKPEAPLQPPPDPTNCSKCGVVLDMIKYVCSTCGEKKPPGAVMAEWTGDPKGKTRAVDIHREATYPPFYGSPSNSSWTVVGSGSGSSGSSGGSDHPSRSMSMSDSTLNVAAKPLPAIPRGPPGGVNAHTQPRPTLRVPGMDYRAPQGYELCSNCVQAYGVQHSLEFSATPGSSPGPGTSPEDAERALSRWRRTAPSQKGVLRHAYIEKSWTHNGWEDVEQGGTGTCRCSTCNTVITSHRYKCASCDDFNLCRACYRQVYEVHPAHAFLQVPDKPSSSQSSSSGMIDQTRQAISLEEPSLTHVGVHCAHCMQEIVGARFHCAQCENIDICQNCDAAGLPGNLDSPDGGHISSHIMIKIPHPIPTADLQSTSQMAIKLWTARDAAHVQAGSANGHARRNSLGSAYSHTVLGTGTRVDAAAVAALEHGIACDGCAQVRRFRSLARHLARLPRSLLTIAWTFQPIVGVRYQCANCPSYPKSVSLCERCEARSYALHDPWHVFFKLPRPVDRPLVLQPPLPRLYKTPAGPAGGVFNLIDPKGYLNNLTHPFAVCDRCMSHIRGEWFHCAYCPKDLCDSCAEVDTHDPTHLFVVFKSNVDMHIFRRFMNEEDPTRSPPLIPFPVYRHHS